MGWSSRERALRRTRTANPESHYSHVLMQSTHGHTEPSENRNLLKQGVCLPSCPSSFHSFIRSLLPSPIHSKLQSGVTLLQLYCMPLVPMKSHYLPEGNHRAKTLQADLLKAQSIPSLGNQPTGAPAKGGAGVPAGASDGLWFISKQTELYWILGHLSPMELMSMRPGSVHCSRF